MVGCLDDSERVSVSAYTMLLSSMLIRSRGYLLLRGKDTTHGSLPKNADVGERYHKVQLERTPSRGTRPQRGRLGSGEKPVQQSCHFELEGLGGELLFGRDTMAEGKKIEFLPRPAAAA
jgi:hypothetical protein